MRFLCFIKYLSKEEVTGLLRRVFLSYLVFDNTYDNIWNIRTRTGLMGSNFQTMTARQLAMEKSVLNVSSDTEPRVKEG